MDKLLVPVIQVKLLVSRCLAVYSELDVGSESERHGRAAPSCVTAHAPE